MRKFGFRVDEVSLILIVEDVDNDFARAVNHTETLLLQTSKVRKA
jgi:hypothetical protein